MSKFIEEQVKKLRESQIQPIRSKVMFKGDFYGEIDRFMIKVEKSIEDQITSKYGIEYTIVVKNSIKIKVNDSEKSIEKLITCNFNYNQTDERYGYIDPQFLSSELSKKTVVYNTGKIHVTDHNSIVKAFIKKLIFVIEEY